MQNISRRLDPIVIISPGRSGSTLLQRYLNCGQDAIIWGEHGGFIRGLTGSYEFLTLPRVQEMLSEGRKYAPLLLASRVPVNMDIEWTNNFAREDVVRVFRELLLSILTIDVPASRRWGFKEIRYSHKDLTFLRELFPLLQYVFMVRNPVDTLASMIAAWAEDPRLWGKPFRVDKSSQAARLQEVEQKCGHILSIVEGIQSYRDRGEGLLVKYEELTATPLLVLREVCSYLNMLPLADGSIEQVAADVRMSVQTGGVRKLIQEEMLENEKVKEVVAFYQSFGYQPERLP